MHAPPQPSATYASFLPVLLLLALLCAACTTHEGDAREVAWRQHAAEQTSDSIRVLTRRNPLEGNKAAYAFLARTRAHNDTIGEIYALNTLGYARLLSGDLDSTRHLFTQSRNIALKLNDSLATLHSLIGLAQLLSIEEKKDSMLLILDEAMRLIDPNRDSTEYAIVVGNKASVMSHRGDFRTATTLLLKALRYFEALGDSARLAVAYGNIGYEYNKADNHETAIIYLQKAVALNTALGSTTELIRDHSNLGVSYEALKMLDKAQHAFLVALDHARRIGTQASIAQSLLNLGNVLALQGDVDSASILYDESMKICKEVHLAYGIMMNHQVRGDLLMQTGRMREAITPLRSALDMAQHMQLLREQLTIHQTLSTLHEHTGNHRQELAHLKAANMLRDSLYGSTTTEAFKRLHAEFDLERSLAENAQLRLQKRLAEIDAEQQRYNTLATILIIILLVMFLTIVQRNRRSTIRALKQVEEQKAIVVQTSEKLAESNRLKELLLDVITHDLIGPVSTISGSADLLREQPDNTHLLDIITRSSARVADVAGMAAALSRIVINEEIPRQQLRVADLITQVADGFRDDLAQAGMVLESHISDDLCINAHPVILEVLENYVSNAIRYASTGGRVIIDGFRDKKGCTLRVTDYGTTIPAEHRHAIFTRRLRLDADTSRGNGLGLAIVARIMHAHGGTAWVEPNAPAGNIFCVRLPHSDLHA